MNRGLFINKPATIPKPNSFFNQLSVASSSMDFKSSFITLFLLLLVFLAQPQFSMGGSMEMGSSDVYEIDYRGPETHSSSPPPDRPHRKKPMIHRHSGVALPESNGSQGGAGSRNTLANGRKIHG